MSFQQAIYSEFAADFDDEVCACVGNYKAHEHSNVGTRYNADFQALYGFIRSLLF